MREGGSEMLVRGAGRAFSVGKLGGVTESDGGGLVVPGFSGAIGGHAVIGTTGQSVTQVLVGQMTSEDRDPRTVTQQPMALLGC
jgi:hypothetical protein